LGELCDRIKLTTDYIQCFYNKQITPTDRAKLVADLKPQYYLNFFNISVIEVNYIKKVTFEIYLHLTPRNH